MYFKTRIYLSLQLTLMSMETFKIKSKCISATIKSEYSVVKQISIQKRYNKDKNGNKVPYTQGLTSLPEEYIGRYVISFLLEETNTNNVAIAHISKNNGDEFSVYGVSPNTVMVQTSGKGYRSGRLLYPGEWLDKQVLIICLPNMN